MMDDATTPDADTASDGIPDRARDETYNSHSLRYDVVAGRPNSRFLEGSASDVIAGMPDPRSAARLAAAIAEAHDASAPMRGLAIVEEAHTGRRTIGHVGLINAGQSTGITVSIETSILSPDAAIELASALIYHAGAARAVHDLTIGHSTGCFTQAEQERRGPPRLPVE